MSIKKVTITTLVSTDDDINAIRSAVDNLAAVVPMGNVLDQRIEVNEFDGDLTESVSVFDPSKTKGSHPEEFIG